MRRFRFPRPDSPVLRLQVQPDKPGAIVAPRPHGSRRPHKDATVAAVRRLIEDTPLNYAEIAARTGVARASICRWTRDGGWKRHLFAPRATDTVPRERASARLKARTLAARLHALAKRYVRELEETPDADLAKLGEALELMKMAKLAARPKRRRKQSSVPLVPVQAGTQDAVLEELRAAGVNIERAPEAAVEDFIASRTPPKLLPRDDPALRQRGHRSKRNREHEWMRGRYRE